MPNSQLFHTLFHIVDEWAVNDIFSTVDDVKLFM